MTNQLHGQVSNRDLKQSNYLRWGIASHRPPDKRSNQHGPASKKRVTQHEQQHLQSTNEEVDDDDNVPMRVIDLISKFSS
mmetsp:Transcript_2597/g.7195  ORF Transcript_2597/g.7195 Transcript_2597/m.7195 type:complete len:80 (+) Transcript_2597:630-869(+)